MLIRPINESDNKPLSVILREVLIEMQIPKKGSAYEDPELDNMFLTYQLPKSKYFVVEERGMVLGGAGISPLKEGDENICELQKMYFLPILRGKGFGSKLIKICLKKAVLLGYKNCYLETMPFMKAATTLYKKNGFINLKKPLGDTGHYSCNVWMIKKL